ncbi:MAG TPA: DUF3106 domain-containing protein, partial [Candidatus Dormibacteraeota bacterium]|nr:DUF3106 domain-containing protein [Candidatus Dormibacteraeota bacterium]
KSLRTLSEADRKQLDKTLRKYQTLSPAQRAQCTQNFEKFTSLTLEERQQFLRNAEKWKLMTLDERQAWKDLVDRALLQPPTPYMVPPLPPSSRQHRLNARQDSLTTSNGN